VNFSELLCSFCHPLSTFFVSRPGATLIQSLFTITKLS
jgi:hypothetical protein